MRTVLVVEDDPDLRAIERTALEVGGFEVVTANNGVEALRTLNSIPAPAVIVLDLMMPVMDGLTFLEERRRAQLASGVPVICVSAAGPELLSRALALGAAECLHKPADFDALCGIVRRYCPP
jgi:CheY-like chemotaxis protein